MIGELCPGLEEMSAKLDGTWGSGSRQKAFSLLPSLHTCRVRILNQETFCSILVHTQKLKVYEVMCFSRISALLPLYIHLQSQFPVAVKK